MIDEIKDSYRVLELKPGASPEAVKEAYRELAKVWHPDRFSGDAKLEKRALEKLKVINLAYERLKKRRPKKNDSAPISGSASPVRPTRRTIRPNSGPAPGVKTYVLPNTRDVKLGILLVGGLCCMIGFLIFVAIFYDDSSAGRRYVADPTAQTKEAKSTGQRAESNSRASLERETELAESPRDSIQTNINQKPKIDEKKFAALEDEERANALRASGVGLAQNAEPSLGRPDDPVTARTGKRLDFTTEQYYKTGIAHLRSTKGMRGAIRAAQYFRWAAERGHPDAQFQLSVMLRDGTGVEANPERALYWIVIAAELGQRQAIEQRTTYETSLTAKRIAELQTQARERMERFRN
jgi:hypothetical protein